MDSYKFIGQWLPEVLPDRIKKRLKDELAAISCLDAAVRELPKLIL